MSATNSGIWQENSPVSLSSEEGIHQGDPLGPVLVSIAVHQTLLYLQNDNPGVKILAYFDDVFLVGPANRVLRFEEVKPVFHRIGLDIQEHECEIHNSTPSKTCQSHL